MKWSGSMWETLGGLAVVVGIYALSTLFEGDVGMAIKGVAATALGLVMGRQVESPREAAARKGRPPRSVYPPLVMLLALLPAAPYLQACAELPAIVTKVVDVAADILRVVDATEGFIEEVAPPDVSAKAAKISEQIRRYVAVLSEVATSEEAAEIAKKLRPLYEELTALGAPYGVQRADLTPQTMGAQVGRVLAVPSVDGLIPPELGR